MKMFDVEKALIKYADVNAGLVKINLGAGNDIKTGWLNHDQVTSDDVDFVFDLNDMPYPLDSDNFDVAYASHVLEHIGDILSCVQEIHRLVKPGGLLIIRTPHYASNCCYGDLSHRHATGYQTFKHLADTDYCRFYGLNKWSSVEFCKLYFAKKWYYPWNYIMQPLASLKPIYYENILGNIFAPFETVTILKK